LIVELLQRDDAMPLSKAAPAVPQNYRIHGFFKAGPRRRRFRRDTRSG
jgi:hypothetical protein